MVIPKVDYVPLASDILTMKPDNPDEWEGDESDTGTLEAGELDEALDDYEERMEQDQLDHEMSAKIDKQIREELGLGPKDVVIVQVKRAKS